MIMASAMVAATQRRYYLLLIGLFLVAQHCCSIVSAEDPTQIFDWVVRYSWMSPLGGPPQKVIVINDQFPGPVIKTFGSLNGADDHFPGPVMNTVTNNVVNITVYNMLDEPFLFTWNGIQLRKNSWQDGNLATNCPIPPGGSWTYVIQFKDQIGSFFYAPSLGFQRAAGGYGGISIANRVVISVPFAPPAAEFTLLVGDWFNTDYKALRKILEKKGLQGFPTPDGIIINGNKPWQTTFAVQAGNTYRLRICNVGTTTSVNVRIGNHSMKVVEAEGTYLKQDMYDSLDLHVGQSVSVLVTMNRWNGGVFPIVASARFVPAGKVPDGVALIRYNYGPDSVSYYPPAPADPYNYWFSLNQTYSLRMNLTTGAARPNPQGSYIYRNIPIKRTVVLANSYSQNIVAKGGSKVLTGRPRCGVNGRSFVYPSTPLLLADYLNIPKIFKLSPFHVPKKLSPGELLLSTFVGGFGLKENFTEFVFQNDEDTLQTWHLDGYSFFVVGLGSGKWTKSSRKQYNWYDAVSRSTIEVYPKSWTAILVQLDNKGIWRLGSSDLKRQYLGQELYLRVWAPPEGPFGDENQKPIPANAILCGKALQH